MCGVVGILGVVSSCQKSNRSPSVVRHVRAQGDGIKPEQAKAEVFVVDRYLVRANVTRQMDSVRDEQKCIAYRNQTRPDQNAQDFFVSHRSSFSCQHNKRAELDKPRWKKRKI